MASLSVPRLMRAYLGRAFSAVTLGEFSILPMESYDGSAAECGSDSPVEENLM
jgi:hypothetical protein